MDNLIMDFYELTMGQAYFNAGVKNKIAYFDVFFRNVPDKGSFVIASGINKALQYLAQFHFSESDIAYLSSLNKFSKEYIDYLSTLSFTGDVYAVEEGTVVLPNEPVITIRAPIIEAQLVETYLLLLFNHNSLITTKASRIVRAAKGRAVMEFGTRRAQGETAAVEGAFDTIMAGVKGTACTQTGKLYGVAVLGTMAHGFIQSFASEYEAFKAYALAFPDDCTLLVDTYNTLKDGVPNAIKTYHEVLRPMGKKLKGIRIDSGDLAYLSKNARSMLDQAGCQDTKIIVSNSLDEKVIESLLNQDAAIDSFGVGEKMITAKSDAILGGVYKLVAIEENGVICPRIKISDNIEKITNPHFKKIYRIYDNNKMFISDIISVYDEPLPSGRLVLQDPDLPWVTKEVNEYAVRELRLQMIKNGQLIYKIPDFASIKQYVQDELATLWPEAKRLENPQTFIVNLSDKLYEIKQKLLIAAK